MEDKRDYFYKYYNIESGILTLQNTKIKWSNPIEFNDPFDNQFNLQFTGTQEEIENKLKEYMITFIMENKPIYEFLPAETKKQLQILQSVSKEDFKKIIPQIKNIDKIYSNNHILESKERFSNEFKNVMSNSLIFCLTEEKDNLLMWAHYADNHTGIVIKFRDVPEKDSPIKLAQKVVYSDKVPTVPIYEIITQETTGRQLREIYSLTKSTQWEYEKEWRIVTFSKNKTREFELLSFAKEEVTDVYLGCRINSENKQKILEIIKTKYPWAGIYQAHKDTKEFKLVFEKIE